MSQSVLPAYAWTAIPTDGLGEMAYSSLEEGRALCRLTAADQTWGDHEGLFGRSLLHAESSVACDPTPHLEPGPRAVNLQQS